VRVCKAVRRCADDPSLEGCALGTGDKLAGASSAEVKNEWRVPLLPPISAWSRHCDTFRMVAGSIPDGVIGIFH